MVTRSTARVDDDFDDDIYDRRYYPRKVVREWQGHSCADRVD
jgi:hypothetical protein